MNWRAGAVPRTFSVEIRRAILAAGGTCGGAWRAGDRPAIEPSVDGREATERSAVWHERVTLEIELGSRPSAPPTLKEYVSRFPDGAEVVGAAFAATFHSAEVATSA